jgi:hypothetical protein
MNAPDAADTLIRRVRDEVLDDFDEELEMEIDDGGWSRRSTRSDRG